MKGLSEQTYTTADNGSLPENQRIKTFTPCRQDFIRNFMLVIGPISSAFDFLTFYILLVLLNADEKLFQTGWFIESLCTQVLVIFIIRTRGNPLKSKLHPVLALTSLLVVVLAITLPLLPLGQYFGFVAPPLFFYVVLLTPVLIYLACVQLAKYFFIAGWISLR